MTDQTELGEEQQLRILRAKDLGDQYSNAMQERLTIVATIFLPLTVVTGFFGQNFSWMINHIGPAWCCFGFGVVGLVISVLAIWLWLARTGMYDRPGRD